MRKVPLSKMGYLVDNLFEEPGMFFLEWENTEADVIAALELVSIALFARADADDSDLWNNCTARIRNWKFFVETAARLSIEALSLPDVLKNRKRFMQSVSSIEVSSFFLMNHLPFSNIFVLEGESGSEQFTRPR